MWFCVENRKKVQKNNKNLTNLEVTRQLGHMWRNMLEKEKKKYINMSNMLKD